MTLSEFKAWFECFSETMEGAPNDKQWERIKSRIAEINGATVTERVFVDRYIEPYRRYWPSVPYWSTCTAGSTTGLFGTSDSRVEYQKANSPYFNSSSAMVDLGRAEYKSVM